MELYGKTLSVVFRSLFVTTTMRNIYQFNRNCHANLCQQYPQRRCRKPVVEQRIFLRWILTIFVLHAAKAASWIYTFRNIGIFLGGIFGDYLGKKGAKHMNPMLTLMLVTLSSGAILYSLPFVTRFYLLNILIFALGLANGYIDSVGQIIIIKNCTQKNVSKLGLVKTRT